VGAEFQLARAGSRCSRCRHLARPARLAADGRKRSHRRRPGIGFMPRRATGRRRPMRRGGLTRRRRKRDAHRQPGTAGPPRSQRRRRRRRRRCRRAEERTACSSDRATTERGRALLAVADAHRRLYNRPCSVNGSNTITTARARVRACVRAFVCACVCVRRKVFVGLLPANCHQQPAARRMYRQHSCHTVRLADRCT
jgi:hypothetical protein